jgi:VIT1/CCC1 family predicted Fe2+/Mn2+ transporter
MEHTSRVQKLQEHIRTDHKRSSLSVHLKEVIYGGVDGIITTFAVVAGFSGAALSNDTTTQLSFLVVLLFGLANLFADGVSMGLGNYLAVRSEQSLYQNTRLKEQHESVHNSAGEVEETITILIEKGFSEKDAQTLAAIYQKNGSYWLDFMMNNELQMPDPSNENPVYTGLATFGAFIAFGCIPLLPFIVTRGFDPQTVFELSALGTLLALVLLGLLKWRIVGGAHPVRMVLEVVLVGSIAATVAFFIGTLFKL